MLYLLLEIKPDVNNELLTYVQVLLPLEHKFILCSMGGRAVKPLASHCCRSGSSSGSDSGL